MDAIGREVRRELDRFGPAAGIAELVAAWPVAVGPAVARNAWPARLARDGTLHVTTSSAAWAFELAQLAPELLTRLATAARDAAPAALRFKVGAVPERAAERDAEDATPAVAASAEERELAAALTAGIADDELRSLVARAAAASLARASADRRF